VAHCSWQYRRRNGVTWKIVSVGGERYPLLGRTVGQTTIDGGVTWTLTSTTPTYADNVAVWTPQFPAHGIIAHTRVAIDDCFIANVNGDGLHYVASTGFALPTNINGSSARRVRMVGTAGHGVLLLGGDSNACYFEAIDVDTTGGYGIWDSSFLGNTHVAHQVATGGRGAYASTGQTAARSWYGCYSEGGQPPSRMLSPAVVIGGLHGAGFTSDCTAVIFSGNNWPHNLTCDRSQELWGYRNGLPFTNRVWQLGEYCLEGSNGKYAHRSP